MGTQYEDWIEWSGGECPLEVGTRHQRKLRNGEMFETRCEATEMTRRAYWQHHGTETDILAYRVVPA